MTDLRRQVKILAHLYESFNKDKQDSYSSLKQIEDLSYIPDEQFNAELRYLIEGGYINNTSSEKLKLSVKGVERTELVFRKFVPYIRKNYAIELSQLD